jgi:hypothetical protein
MSKALRNGLIILAVLIIAGGLVFTGFLFGRSAWGYGGFWHNTMMGYSPEVGNRPNTSQAPYSMMGGYTGQGSYSFGNGMMGGYGGGGMMGGYGSSGLNTVEPLTIQQAQDAVEGYLKRFNDADLEIKEIMIFDNQAYAEIVEKSTGIGAMEVLVDPVTLAVYPEFGPNMMWNLKYGMMSGNGSYGMMGGGMMGGRWQGSVQTDTHSEDMPVGPEKAVEIAQEYLDQYLAGTQVEDHADVFYGYYTLHVGRDGDVIGMLSVNGYSGQVFPHTWHGDFIEMSEED